MRMQEQLARKKFKPHIADVSDGEESRDDSTNASHSGSEGEFDARSQKTGDDDEEESGSSEVEEDSEAGSGEAGSNKAGSDEAAIVTLPNWDDGDSRFSSSRIGVVPRAIISRQAESAKPARTRPTTFEALDISSALLNALAKMSITAPTEIQAVCIPPLLAGE